MADIDQQPHEDLSGNAARSKIQEICKDFGMCMFHTDPASPQGDVRPMAIQEVDDQGIFWFLSARDSQKNRDIQKDQRVILTCQNDSNYAYLSISGTATIHADAATIDKYWSKMADAWFEGKNDPRVSVIRVEPQMGHYWQTKHGKIVSLVKMGFSMVTGSKHPDDGGVDGALKV